MKKTILFRGKRTTGNKEWVYGYYVRANRHWHEYGVLEDWIITDVIQNGGMFNVGRRYPVDAKTVGQFTGLTDKNGKKIFEGDILRGFAYPFRDGEGKHNYYAEVVWFENSSAFGLVTHKNPKSNVVGISEGNCEYMENWETFLWEIIGNIYDNKELIGK